MSAAPEMNLSKNFQPFDASQTASHDAESADEVASSAEPRTFELTELVPPDRVLKREFAFDSENEQNFDQRNIDKAREGVKEIFADAMTNIKAQAKILREEGKNQGYEAGYAEGFKAGEQAAREASAPLLETLKNAIRDVSEFRTLMYPKVEREMIKMIVGLTQKVIQVELGGKEDRVKEMIRLAVQSVLDRESMVLQIHPDDLKHAQHILPALQQEFHEIKNVTLEGRPSIPRGSCIVDTNFGTIEARFDDLQDQIEKILHLAPPLPDAPGSS